MLRVSIWVALLAIPAIALSDSIKVGEDVYTDVYVDSDEEYYYIRFPETGKVEKVSRQRLDIGELKIDEDAAARSQMLDRFEENRVMAEKKADKAASGAAVDLDTETIEEDARLKDRALFDAQVAYWKELSEEDRDAIEDYLLSLTDAEDAKDAIVRTKVADEIVDLEAQKARHQARLAQLAQLKENALAEAQRMGRPDLFAQIYRASVYDVEAIPHGQAVNSLNSAVDNTVSAGVAEESKTIDQRIRIGTFLARLDQLSDAVDEEYTSPLNATVVASWKDSVSQETPEFEIDAPFWRLDCLREDLGAEGDFAITVYDAKTKTPFTKIAGVDFLQMRVRILDGPGRYYLKIEQDDSNIPYEVRAVTFSE